MNKEVFLEVAIGNIDGLMRTGWIRIVTNGKMLVRNKFISASDIDRILQKLMGEPAIILIRNEDYIIGKERLKSVIINTRYIEEISWLGGQYDVNADKVYDMYKKLPPVAMEKEMVCDMYEDSM